MEKIKGYLGIGFAVLLGISLLAPDERYSRPGYGFDHTLTPFDHTNLTINTIYQSNAYNFWAKSTSFLSVCAKNGDTPPPSSDLNSTAPCEFLFEHINPMVIFDIFYPVAAEIDPKLPDRWLDYLQSTSYGTEPPRTPDLLNERLAIASLLSKPIVDQYKSVQTSLSLKIWALNAGALLLVLALIYFRRYVGNVLLFPIYALFTVLRVGTKEAKKLHDRV